MPAAISMWIRESATHVRIVIGDIPIFPFFFFFSPFLSSPRPFGIRLVFGVEGREERVAKSLEGLVMAGRRDGEKKESMEKG